MGLGRNKWRFLSFVGTRLSESRAPSGPHTTPLAPTFIIWPFLIKRKCLNHLPFIGAIFIRRKCFMTARSLFETPKEQQERCTEICVMKLCDGFIPTPH